VRQVDGGRAFLVGVAIGAVMMSAIGLVASGLIESPLQVAAETAPPSPSVLTATARWQVLENTIILRGTVTAARIINVIASAPYSQIIVTRMPVKAGQRVRPGQLVTEIDGRPIFLLGGRLPAYRSLHEGDAGPDVSQLQHALERLGYLDFDQPGHFGESTALALLLFYRHLGYAAPIYHPAVTGPLLPPVGPTFPAAKPTRPAHAARPAAAPVMATAGTQLTATGLRIPDAYLPMSEVIFIPASSALVVAVNARLGTAVTAGPVLRLATGEPIVTGKLGQAQARLVRAGMSARITSAGPRLSAPGIVTQIGSYPVANGQVGQGAGYPLAVTGLRPLPQSLIGHRVRLTLYLAATSGPVLAVPLAAVVTADGRAEVIRLTAGQRRVRVVVRTGISAGGLVAVQPVLPGTLGPGDRVVLGLAG